MPLSRRLLALIGIVAVAVVVAVVLIAAGGEDHSVPAGAVADVKGKPVTKQEFDHWLGVVTAVQAPPNSKKKPQPPKPGSQQYEQVSQQVMQFLVSAKWIEGEAAERDIAASPQEIQRQFKETKDQSFPNEKAYKRFLRTSGQTENDILYRVKLDVISNKLRQEVTREATDVSDGEIEDYYDQNEQQFSQPERRDLRVVLTKTEAKAQDALKRLQGGESFNKVAKELSTDPATKEQGGRLLGIAKGQQEQTFDGAIFSAVKGKLVGPVKTAQGFYVFQVSKVTPATKQTLEQSKEGIRQLLVSQKQQKVLDSFTQDFRKQWRGDTDCRKGYVIPDCSNGKEPPPPGLGTGPPAKSGAGQPPALGGGQQAPTTPGVTPGLPGAAPPTGAGASSPPGLTGAGSPPALGGAPPAGGAPAGVPGGAVPQGGAPQGGAPQQGAPQQGAPQQGAPQQGAQP